MPTDVGGTYRTTLRTLDADGSPVDPLSKTLTVTLPDQTTVTPAITDDSPGVFHVDYKGATEGLYAFTWSAIDPDVSKTDYENFIKFRSVVGLSEMRAFLNLKDTARDETLRGCMMAATELAESIVGTCVARIVTDEMIPGYERPVIRLPQAPLIAVTSIESAWPAGPAWLPADLIVSQESGVIEPANMQGFYLGPWRATYTAGRAIVPQGIILAVKEIVFDLWATQRMADADQLEPGLEETAQYETAMPPGYQIPPHAKALLERAGAQPGFA